MAQDLLCHFGIMFGRRKSLSGKGLRQICGAPFDVSAYAARVYVNFVQDRYVRFSVGVQVYRSRRS